MAVSLAARFNLGTWCYYKIFQTVSPVMQHEGYRQAGFLPTCTQLPIAEALQRALLHV